MKRILIFAILLILGWTNITLAGFGISPGHITNDRLYPGASFETKFILSRGNPTEDHQAQFSVDAPEIEDWFTFLPSEQVLLPKGEQRVPVTVKIDVPKDAEYKNYKGYLNVKAVPVGGERESGVSVVLGARLDVNLNVSKVEIIDFVIRNPHVLWGKEGFHWWKIELPAKIGISMNVENTGNVDSAPGMVAIEVWGLNWKNMVAEGSGQPQEKVKPFEKKDIETVVKLDLEPGKYWALVKIFKDEEGKELLREAKLPLEVVPFKMSGKELAGIAGLVAGIILVIISMVFLWKKGLLGKLIFRK